MNAGNRIQRRNVFIAPLQPTSRRRRLRALGARFEKFASLSRMAGRRIVGIDTARLSFGVARR